MTDSMPTENGLDHEAIVALLRMRAGDCWDRIEDAAIELASVHEVPDDEILRHVMRTLATERSSAS
jgi:hypothetical protein